jgi:chitodextrinase
VVAAGDPVIMAGGDIACPPGKAVNATHCKQASTGTLISTSGASYVLPLGDTQYDSSTTAEYLGSYDSTGWGGTTKQKTRPASGNHEYRTAGATGYYNYFGANAGDPSKGYYSWDIVVGTVRWHMIALNSECAVLGGGSISAGCGANSPQVSWLKSDLAASTAPCTIAYWHRPRFSSSTTTPSSTTYVAIWNALYAGGAEIVLNGHAHDYERFSPQTSSGASDSARGLVEIVNGNGGYGFHSLGGAITNSVVRNNTTFGVLKLTLGAAGYTYQFVPISGSSFSDSGSGNCHSKPGADTAAPGTPSGVTASATTANQATVTWTAPADNVAVKAYHIHRARNGENPILLDTVPRATERYVDESVVADTTYTYQVEAIDAAGNTSQPSPRSAPARVPASTDTSRPGRPPHLEAEVVFRDEVNIGWDAATDTGTGVSGYEVYRQEAGGPPTLIATTEGTGPGKTSYVDLTVRPNTGYRYHVEAIDGNRNKSDRSNTVAVTTWE